MCNSRVNHPELCDTCCPECEACPVFSLEDHRRHCSKALPDEPTPVKLFPISATRLPDEPILTYRFATYR
jgi:hypothetical protein